MSIQFLESIANQPLPVTLRTESEMDMALLLCAAELVAMEKGCDGDCEVVFITGITPAGWHLLKERPNIA